MDLEFRIEVSDEAETWDKYCDEIHEICEYGGRHVKDVVTVFMKIMHLPEFNEMVIYSFEYRHDIHVIPRYGGNSGGGGDVEDLDGHTFVVRMGGIKSYLRVMDMWDTNFYLHPRSLLHHAFPDVPYHNIRKRMSHHLRRGYVKRLIRAAKRSHSVISSPSMLNFT